MKRAENDNHRYQSKEAHQWSGEITRLQVEVTNPRKRESEVRVFRLGDRDKPTSATRRTRIPPEETYRFIVSKSEPEETGVVICYESNLRIRLSELSDRARLPEQFKESEGRVQLGRSSLRGKLKYSLPWQKGLPPWMSKLIVYPAYCRLKGLRTLEFLKELEVSQPALFFRVRNLPIHGCRFGSLLRRVSPCSLHSR